MRLFLVPLLALFVSCGVEQESSGEGWLHLGWYATPDGFADDPEIFRSVEEAEVEFGIEIEDPGSPVSSEEFILVFRNFANGCGPSLFDDIATTQTGLSLVNAVSGNDERSCEEFARLGVTVFAIDDSLLPQNDGEITFDRDDGINSGQFVIQLPE